MKFLRTIALTALVIAPAAFAANADSLLYNAQPAAPVAAADANDPIMQALNKLDLDALKQRAQEVYSGVKQQAGNAVSKAGNVINSARNNPELQARLDAAKGKAVAAKEGVVDYLQNLLGEFNQATTPATNPATGLPYAQPVQEKGWLDSVKDAYNNYASQNAPTAKQPAANQPGVLGSLWNALSGSNAQPAAPAQYQAPAPAQYQAPAPAQSQGLNWAESARQAQNLLGQPAR